MTLTPDKIRKRDKAVRSVGERWYLDFSTQEIRRNPLSGLAKVKQFFWRDINTIWELYIWLRHRQAEPDAMAYSNQMDGDNLPMKGFPIKYALAGGWTIPQADLKYLRDGPLASEDRHEILVTPSRGWHRVTDVVKQFAPVFSVIASMLVVAKNWSTVTAIASWIANAF
jgi:hypothetical protein